MAVNQDQPLEFHHSFNELLDTFRNVITSLTWLKVSIQKAAEFYQDYPYIIELDCSVITQKVKIDKSILRIIGQEGFNAPTPMYTKTLINFYRVITLALKDMIWEESAFQPFLQNEELQFLRHLRNASAHNNQFFWGQGRQRTNTIQRLPISWRSKIIDENLEGTKLYMDFMKPGDIFMLLSDISSLVQ